MTVLEAIAEMDGWSRSAARSRRQRAVWVAIRAYLLRTLERPQP